MTMAPGISEAPAPIPAPGDLNLITILLRAVEVGASDIHLSTGYPPQFRVHSLITPTQMAPLTGDDLHAMLYDVLDDDQRRRLERDKELDFALQIGNDARFRVNCFYNYKGEGAVFRVIPTEILTFEQLGMPPVLRDLCDRPRGIVLVTGPTGSGKSTTLAAMIDTINSNKDLHILTIEDPIEFIHAPKRGVVNQRELGPNTHSFAAALRSALREDPDVILVGEMRDLETISLALTAAETGHLVFGTLHTQSAPKTCDRIVDVFPPDQQKLVRLMFAESFQAIICQQLLRRRDGKGRVAALEIMIGTAATRSLIREGKTHQLPSIIQTSQRFGMQSLDQNLKDLVMRGVVNERDALEKANNPEFIRKGANQLLQEGRRPQAASASGTVGSGGGGSRLGSRMMPTMDEMEQPAAPSPPPAQPAAGAKPGGVASWLSGGKGAPGAAKGGWPGRS